MKTWMNTRMSLKQMEKALERAGIPTNPPEWTAEQVEEAGRVLDDAQSAHEARS